MNVNTRTDSKLARQASAALKRINERNARDVKRRARPSPFTRYDFIESNPAGSKFNKPITPEPIKKSKIYEFDLIIIQDSKGNNRVQIWIARDGGSDRSYIPRAKSLKRIENLYQNRQYNPRIEFDTYIGTDNYQETTVWIRLLNR